MDLVRKNDKQQVLSYENSIKKSNELSMAKLSHGLTLNQMQLLAFAIFSTQQDGKTEFIKADFEKRFNIEYKTEHARDDASVLSHLQFSIENLEDDHFEYWNIFGGIHYKNGLFTFKWNGDFVPHILEIKEKYVTADLTVTSQFKSGFSWTLYDYLKAHYGYWHKPISKEALMKLFGVEDRKTYQNTAQFKRAVLDVAIAEINKYTELEVWYKEEKKGRAIVGFDLIWSTGKREKSATKKQIQELKATLDMVLDDIFRYVDVDNTEKRKKSIRIVEEMRQMFPFTQEPICITYNKADTLIVQAKSNLAELNRMIVDDGKSDILNYNWLEEQ